MNQITVTITVEINGESKTYAATGSSSIDPHRVAEGLLSSVKSEADKALQTARIDGETARRRAATRTGLGVF